MKKVHIVFYIAACALINKGFLINALAITLSQLGGLLCFNTLIRGEK